MTVDDRTRLNLHRRLESVLGSEEANTLMAHLPPVTWNEVATKHDLQALGSELRTEMQMLRTELRSEIQVATLTLRAEFVEASSRQIKWLVTFAAAWSTLLVTAVRLLP
jgi:hypothetical protein